MRRRVHKVIPPAPHPGPAPPAAPTRTPALPPPEVEERQPHEYEAVGIGRRESLRGEDLPPAHTGGGGEHAAAEHK